MNEPVSYAGLVFTGVIATLTSIAAHSMFGLPGLPAGTVIIVGAGVFIGRQDPEDIWVPAFAVAIGPALIVFLLGLLGHGYTEALLQAVKSAGRVTLWCVIAAWITRSIVRSRST